jgi:hypothetical protein
MGELESLLLVLVVLYLAECLVWLRRGTVSFFNWWGLARTRWRVRHPGSTLANQHGAVSFTNPLPPLGTVFFGQQTSLSISPDAALAYTAACLNPSWRASQSARFVRFEEMKTITRDGRKVLVNDQLFLKATSPFVARRTVKGLRELQEATAKQREAIIQRTIAASFDEKSVRERVQEFQKRSANLRVLANSLFIFLYIIAPLLVWRFAFLNVVWWLVAGLLVHTVSIAILFRRAHGHLYPGCHDERFTPFFTMLLAPPSAVRAVDALGKHLLENFHALAAAKVLLTTEDFREFARRVVLDLRYPMFPICPSADPMVVKTEESFRHQLRDEAEKFVSGTGLKLEELLRPPPRSEVVNTAYCPRCGAQFTTSDGACSDCGGRPLAVWN